MPALKTGFPNAATRRARRCPRCGGWAPHEPLAAGDTDRYWRRFQQVCINCGWEGPAVRLAAPQLEPACPRCRRGGPIAPPAGDRGLAIVDDWEDNDGRNCSP